MTTSEPAGGTEFCVIRMQPGDVFIAATDERVSFALMNKIQQVLHEHVPLPEGSKVIVAGSDVDWVIRSREYRARP